MIPGYAVLRLMWRPALLLALLVLLWAVVTPLAKLAESTGDPIGAILGGGSSEDIRLALWHLVVLVPTVIGASVAVPRLELLHSALFAHHLPALRTRLMTGTLGVGAIIAAAFAGHFARIDSPAVALAAFALALLWFMVPALVLDSTVWSELRFAGAAAFVLAAWRPGIVAQAAEGFPLAVAVACAVLVIPLALTHFSRKASRLRPFTFSQVAGTDPRASRMYWAGRRERPGAAEWTRPLATDQLMPWVRAVAYQSGSFGDSLLRPYIMFGGIAALLAYVVNSPLVLIIVAETSALGPNALIPGVALFHPIGRSQRAKLVFVGTLIGTATFFGSASLLLMLAEFLPRNPLGFDVPDMGLSAAIGAAIALAPLAQWGPIHAGRHGKAHRGRSVAYHFTWGLGYMISAVILAAIVAREFLPDITGRLAFFAALAIAVQAIHWVMLRRYYSRADLTVQ